MEKRRPQYPLSRVKSLVEDGEFRVTRTALRCAVRGFGLLEASAVAAWVLRVRATDFYKSMTTLHDATLWQDVYRPNVEGSPAYVKVQIVDDTTVVISFKALEDG